MTNDERLEISRKALQALNDSEKELKAVMQDFYGSRRPVIFIPRDNE